MAGILKIDNLTKIYTLGSIFSRTKITAVDKVSFELNKSEILTLAGESGCGKTTTSKIILGFEEPTSGRMYYRDKEISSIPKSEKKQTLKEIQAVFQNPFSTFNHCGRLTLTSMKRCIISRLHRIMRMLQR